MGMRRETIGDIDLDLAGLNPSELRPAKSEGTLPGEVAMVGTRRKPIGDIIDIKQAITEEPPQLDYVLPNFVAGTVGALVSPGGAGKSMLALQLGVQLTTGLDLLGIGEQEAGEVAYFPAEDPPAAVRQRLHAIGGHLDELQRAKLIDRLAVQCLVGKRRNILDDDWLHAFQAHAEGRRLMVLDTFRRFHTEEENSSGAMSEVIGRLEFIAAQSGCAILFLHHTNKGSAFAGAGDLQQASRGSSVLVDNVRWQGYLAKMSKAEAENYAVTDTQRHYFVRFGISKANYGKPFPERWLRRNEGGVLKPAVLEQEGAKRRDRA